MLTKDKLEIVSKLDLKLDIKDRSIDPEKVQIYLKNLDSLMEEHDQKIAKWYGKSEHTSKLRKEYAEKIIKVSRYIPFSVMFSKLVGLLDQLPEKYYLMLNTEGKVGSEHWLIALIWDKIKSRVIDVFKDHVDIPDVKDTPIVMIDDCIYSGTRMTGMIDEFRYSYQKMYGRKSEHQFIVLVPYATRHGTKLVKSFPPVKIITGEYLTRCFASSKRDLMYKLFGCEDLCVPVYFDHKIANAFGSFPMIYPHIVKELPSRMGIEKLSKVLEEM